MTLPLRHLLLLLAALVAMAAPMGAQAQPRGLEYPLKAAFLTKFAAFVDWPGGARSGAVRLCVAGDDPFGAALDQAVAASGGAVALRRLPEADAAAPCDILYVAGSKTQSTADGLEAVRGQPILTVTDAARGPARGMIHFVLFQDRIRFHIDAEQAARNGLVLSSKLLALALSVKR